MTFGTFPLTRFITYVRQHNPELKRFIKFIFVGALGFVVDFGSFNLLHALGFGVTVGQGLSQPYLVEHPEIAEQTASFALAVLSNFIWNYFWIYPEARQANQAKKLTKFAIVSVAGLLIGVPVFSAALLLWRPTVDTLGLATLPLNLAGNLALMTRVAVLMFWNFFVNRYWTYNDVKRR